MKRAVVMLALAAICGMSHADELSDAQRLWDNKDFAGAFSRFAVLAERGNVAAQLQLGEMYGFGEGTAPDIDKAVYWLNRAKAGGNAEADESLALVRERVRRAADIAAYTTSFDGAKVRYESYGCARPVIPAVSTTNQDIKAVNGAVTAWAECYGRFVLGINSGLPANKTIPADVLRLMSNAEFIRASDLITRTYQQLVVQPQAMADTVMAENLAWKSATDKYVKDNNLVQQGVKDKERIDYEILSRGNANAVRAMQDLIRSKRSNP